MARYLKSFIWKLFFLVKVTSAYSTPPSPIQTVIVVGGGVGGLATAARIASTTTDTKVLILEKNEQLGGRCGSFIVSTDKGDFRHERGPSLLLLKDVYLDLFTDCATASDSNKHKDASDYGLEMRQCSPAYQVVFEDGDRIELGFPITDSQLEKAQTKSRSQMNMYETDGALKWDEYMQAMAAYLECGLPNFIEERLDILSFPAFLYEALREKAKAWPLKPHSDVLDAIFDSTKMKALASFQNLYVGLEPYRNDKQLGGGVLRKTAPAVFGLLAAIELHPTKGGVFAPMGGFDAVTKAMQKLAIEHDVEIQCGATVTKVTEEGVHFVDNQMNERKFLPSDLVLINADLPFATETLLKEDKEGGETGRESYDWNDKFDYSSGVIAFHWSVDKELSDLNTHNVFLIAENEGQSRASWRALRNDDGENTEVEPFNFYVHRASKTDPSAAPGGCDAILVLVPCQTLKRNPDWASLPRDEAIMRYKRQFDTTVVSKARDAVLQRLSAIESLKGLEKHIIDETVDTPGTYADQYNVAAGTPFAISHGFGQLSLTRPGAKSSSLPNTFFVGASSRPGNGVPLVLIGAKLAAEKVLKRLKSLQG